MELHGERRSESAGVKVKFIETQFVSSDAASFKSVVQRLTGKHSQMPPPPSVHRPRPRSSSGSIGAGEERRRPSNQLNVAAPPKQVPAAVFEPARMEMEEQLHGLCDFADLFYATPGVRREGGGIINGFPY